VVNKRGGAAAFVIIFVLLALGFIIFIAYRELSNDDDTGSDENLTIEIEGNQSENDSIVSGSDNGVISETFLEDDFSNISEIHWGHMPLTYNIENRSDCEGLPIRKVEEAFEKIEDLTDAHVSFIENKSSEADILINCIDGAALLEEAGSALVCKNFTFDYYKPNIHPEKEGLIEKSDYFVSEETVKRNNTETVYLVCYIDSSSTSSNFNWGALAEAEYFSEEGVIKSASLNIYKPGSIWTSCSGLPTAKIHQILHTFGFGHSYEPGYESGFGWIESELYYLEDVMFPYSYCIYQRAIDEKYTSCLKRIYSNGELAGNCSGVSFS